MGKNSKVAAQRPWRMKRVAASVRSALSDRRSRWKAALVLPATLAALPVATGAHALNLGEIEPLSAIGQPFRARVALYRGAEESLQSACVSMRASRLEGNAHVPIGLPAQARLESRGAREYLFIESGEMLSEPVVQLRIEVRCPASEGVSREYLVLQDPPDPLADTTPVHPHPAASPSTPAPAPADTWARPQDGPATRPATAPRASAIARASAPAPEARRTAAPRPAARAQRASPARPASPAPPASPASPAPPAPPALHPARGSTLLARAADQRIQGMHYELTTRVQAPVAQAQAGPMRGEFGKPLPEGDVAPLVLDLRDEVRRLNLRMETVTREHQAELTRQVEAARAERNTWALSGALAGMVLAFAIWAWSPRARRERRASAGPAPGVAGRSDAQALRVPEPSRAAQGAAARPDGEDAAPREDGTMRGEPGRVPPRAACSSARAAPADAAPAAASVASAPSAQTPLARVPLPAHAGDDLARAQGTPAFAFGPTNRAATRNAPAAPRPSTVARPPVREPVRAPAPAPRQELLLADDSNGSPSSPARGVPGRLEVMSSNLSDAGAAANRAAEYRNAYIAERFPEIAAGSISLHKPASVVEGARAMYQEDLDVPRAVGLLQLASALYPEQIAPWLALFEIHWQEHMQPEYLDLAQRFQAQFSRENEHWPMIAKLGREIGIQDGLFSPEGLAAVDEEFPNWLRAELDMVTHMLASELRAQVLEGFGNTPLARVA